MLVYHAFLGAQSFLKLNCFVYVQIAFTGSTATGSKIMTAAAQQVKVCHGITLILHME